MVDFKDYAVNLLLCGLFVIALVAFGTGIAHNYGEDASLMSDDRVNMTRLESTVNSTSEDAQRWSEAFQSDNLFVSAGGIVLYSIWGVGKLILTSVVTLFVVIFDGVSAVLGIPPVVSGVIFAVLLIGLIFALWRVIKAGY